LFFTVNGADKI